MPMFVDKDRIENLKKEKEIKRLKEELNVQDEIMASMYFELMMLQEPVSVMTFSIRSPKFGLVKKWFDKGFWSEEMVAEAVAKGIIREEERIEITGK